MPSRIEDYAIIGDARTVALVGRDGSIDWWCAPRIDSAASFAALLGDARNGRWIVDPVGDRSPRSSGAYRPDTMVLETTFTTANGRAVVIDFMPRSDLEHPAIVRVVRGLEGTVRFGSEVVVRFDYGALVPWVRHHDGGVEARGGADGVVLHSSVRDPRPRPDDLRRVRRHRGLGGVVRAGLVPVPRGAARGARRRSAALEGTDPLVARLGRRRAPRPGPGATRWCGRCSPSRPSPTSPPAASSPRPPPRCRSGSAACATGTTATAGCATPPSP